MTGIHQPLMQRKTGFITAMRSAPITAARKAKERACMIDAKIRLMAVYQIVSDAFAIGAGTFDNQSLG